MEISDINNAVVMARVSDIREIMQSIVDEAIERHFDRLMAEEDALMSTGEASAALGVDRSTLWHWDKEGYLKKIYVGGKPKYRKGDIDAILGRKQKVEQHKNKKS